MGMFVSVRPPRETLRMRHQHSQAPTCLLSFSCTFWASEKTRAWMEKTNQAVCLCLSPARGVLIKLTDDTAVDISHDCHIFCPCYPVYWKSLKSCVTLMDLFTRLCFWAFGKFSADRLGSLCQVKSQIHESGLCTRNVCMSVAKIHQYRKFSIHSIHSFYVVFVTYPLFFFFNLSLTLHQYYRVAVVQLRHEIRLTLIWKCKNSGMLHSSICWQTWKYGRWWGCMSETLTLSAVSWCSKAFNQLTN